MAADLEQSIQAELDAIAVDLDAIVSRLEKAHASVPVSLQTVFVLESHEDLGEATDFPTVARSTIECILEDRLRPAIRALRTLACFGRVKREDE
jgi:hypothetical protein